jgi:hypothetical protein
VFRSGGLCGRDGLRVGGRRRLAAERRARISAPAMQASPPETTEVSGVNAADSDLT